MTDLAGVVRRARVLRAERRPFLLATLVATHGSSYRRPGARLVVAEDGRPAGGLSGGCVERDLIRRGWWYTSGGPAVITFEASEGGDDEGSNGFHGGSGCGGAVDVLVERNDDVHEGDEGALGFIDACLTREMEGALVTVYRSTVPGLQVGAWSGVAAGERWGAGRQGSRTEASRTLDALAAAAGEGPTPRSVTFALDGGTGAALVELVRPPPHLFVMGTGGDASALAAYARALAWTTTVWDPQPRFETRERFAHVDLRHVGPAATLAPRISAAARAAAVVVAHDLARDREALAMLRGTTARYIGIVGPRRRTDGLMAEVGAISPARLHAPAGLSVGAETPAEIALSIATEIQAVLCGATVGHLRDRVGAIHAPGSSSRPSLAGADGRLASIRPTELERTGTR